MAHGIADLRAKLGAEEPSEKAVPVGVAGIVQLPVRGFGSGNTDLERTEPESVAGRCYDPESALDDLELLEVSASGAVRVAAGAALPPC